MLYCNEQPNRDRLLAETKGNSSGLSPPGPNSYDKRMKRIYTHRLEFPTIVAYCGVQGPSQN